MKIILKIITLFLIILLASCEAEKIITHTGQKSYDSQKISLSKFLEETGENNFEPIVRIKYHSVNISGKSTNSKYDLIDFDIDTNVINSMMVFNKNTYTFRVKPKDYTGTNLFNLIYYKKNNTWKKTILEMKPTADNLYKLQNGLTTKFEGEIKQILSSEKTTIKSKSTSREGCSLFTIIVKDCHGCVGKCDECLICWTYTSFFLYDSGGGDSGGGGGDFSSGVGPNQGAGGSSYSFPDANAPDTTFFEPNTNNLQGELDEIYATKFNEFINSLQSTNITSFNYLNQNPTVKMQIFYYFANNSFSSDSNAFAIEILNQIKLNPNLNLNIAASYNSPLNIDFGTISNHTPEGKKFLEIYDALTKSPEFKTLFKDLFENSNRFNVKFEIGALTSSANGNTRVNIGGFPICNTITISPAFLNSANKMEIAKTILHECIHAFLNIKLYDTGQGAAVSTLNSEQLFHLINHQYNGFSGSQDQHNFIYTYMLPTMVTILSQVKDTLVTTDNNYEMEHNVNVHIPYDNSLGTNFIWSSYFHNLSLAGLHNCPFFQNEIATITYPNGIRTITNIINQTLLQSYIQYIDVGHLNIHP